MMNRISPRLCTAPAEKNCEGTSPPPQHSNSKIGVKDMVKILSLSAAVVHQQVPRCRVHAGDLLRGPRERLGESQPGRSSPQGMSMYTCTPCTVRTDAIVYESTVSCEAAGPFSVGAAATARTEAAG